MTVVPAANSVEGLRRIREQQAVPDDDPWYVWGCSEWAYAAAEASPFNAICGKLADDVLARSSSARDSRNFRGNCTPT